MKKYNHKDIEKKWKKQWEKSGIYKTTDPGFAKATPGKITSAADKPKYYVLDMFPYPSGAGLHVGHPKGYIATDIVARQKMMQGYNVLHPMGWDAFGLPAENYALKNKVHPADATTENIKVFKKQLGLLGFTYDWDREVNTTDPEYYKWTQWIFLQLFKKGLAYESNEPINWCPSCKTGLANEDLEDGKCERCGSVVEQKPLRQWVLKITDYAERLLNDIELLKEWPEPIKEMQRNWIGRKEGINIEYQVEGSKHKVICFTTRPDTNFGATFVVIGPEHPLVLELSTAEQKSEVEKYVKETKNKTELDRISEGREKSGVFTGSYCVNNLTDYRMPIWVADYVLGHVGTGAVVGVPGHDKRDFEFADKFGIEIKRVVVASDGDASPITKIEQVQEHEGKMINSGFLDGLDIHDATHKIMDHLEEKGWGKRIINYKLRDWVFSRQRYWGEPIPLVNCAKCGWQAVPENELPLELPKVKNYEPTGTGESPLAGIDSWVNTKCPHCGGPAKRETNTMPQWAGSCWYYLAYTMRGISNFQFPISKYRETLDYWNPVDFYVGGAEHATRHLIYARFWHKFLFDIGAVGNIEPFTKLQNVGLILAEDGRKMSKRWNNVINPDDVVSEFGADAMRLYEMFMGPFDQPCAWSTKGVVGCRRFLEKVWNLSGAVIPSEARADEGSLSGSSKQRDRDFSPTATGIRNDSNKLEILLNQTIKKVGEDISAMRFNTAISQLMIFANEATATPPNPPLNKRGTGELPPSKLEGAGGVNVRQFQMFVQLLAPFAPHLSEELWEKLGNKESIFKSEWPKFDPNKIQHSEINLVVQINGKVRENLVVSADITEEDAKAVALASEKVQKWLEGKEPRKVIYVKGKLISIVI